MIRSILRTLSRFLMACVLFALLLCAVEVWFRWERFSSTSQQAPESISIAKVVQPSSTTWVDVVELLDMPLQTDLSEATHVRTTEFGTRGSELTVPKPQGVFRVLCLGGAELFGVGQPEEQTITAQLQALFQDAKLKHVEFVNAGCPGSGPLSNYLRVRTRLIALQPDVILFCISPDDVRLDAEVRGGLTLDDLGKPAYATHPTLEEQTTGTLNLLCQEFATADWIVNQLGPIVGLKPRTYENNSKDKNDVITFEPLIELKRLVNQHQCRLMISVIPNAWSAKPQTGNMNSKNVISFERDLHTFFADHGIPSTSLVHNPILMFQQNGEQQSLFDERAGTLNQMGNVMYARTLAKSLVDYIPSILNVPAESELSETPGISTPPHGQNEISNGPLTRQPLRKESVIQ